MAVPWVKFLVRSLLPEGRCVSPVCLLLGAGTAPPCLLFPLIPLQDRLPSPLWEDRFSQARSSAVWSWHLPTLNSPFFLSAAWELGRWSAGRFSHWETGWGLGNPSALVKQPGLGPSLGILYNAEMARERELCGYSPLPSGRRWVGRWHWCGLRNVAGCGV